MRVVSSVLTVVGMCLLFQVSAEAREDSAKLLFVKAKAANAQERTLIANEGIAIDGVLSDSVTFFATQEEIERLKKRSVQLEVTEVDQRDWGFPGADAAFHDYGETLAALDKIATDHPDIARTFSIGTSIEGRDLKGVRLSARMQPDSLPTVILMGCHHAREHLSVEVPLMMAEYLSSKYGNDPTVTRLLQNREVWIVPMVNPDGAEHDIHTGSYKMWRKNRRDNGDGTWGVDLNRNYGTGWGGPGSSGSTSSDTYRGTAPFSEPETVAVREFVKDRKKTTVMISFHTFSELVLWPFGHTNSDIPNSADRKVFETMGKKMASWNGYKPMKSSGLYLASGDTTDWAYDELSIFAFTFELSPRSMFQGGFYPGASAIQPTFKANLEPVLYLIEMAENPYRSLREAKDPLQLVQ